MSTCARNMYRHEIKLIVKQILCINSVKYWDKYTEMQHGQQNVKNSRVSFLCWKRETCKRNSQACRIATSRVVCWTNLKCHTGLWVVVGEGWSGGGGWQSSGHKRAPKSPYFLIRVVTQTKSFFTSYTHTNETLSAVTFALKTTAAPLWTAALLQNWFMCGLEPCIIHRADSKLM